MVLSFIKIKQFFIPIENENAIHYLPVDAIKKPIRPFDTTLHSKADRGGDEESTQAYVLVRRGVCRGDNKDMHMKATWYEPRLRSMVVLSCAVHCVLLALFFFIQGQQSSPLNSLACSTLVSLVNLNSLPGSGDSRAIAPLTPETKKEGVPKTPPLSMPLQKKSTVKQTKAPAITPEKLPVPPQANAVSPPFDSVNKEPVCLATPSLSDFGNDSDSPEGYEKSENFATCGRELFSRDNGSGKNSRGSGGGAAGDPYLQMVRSKIEQHKIYPRQASIRQIQGTVIIHFIITLEGIIKGVDVVQSSGFTVLDRAGLKAVKDASPFPKPPVEFFQTAVSIEVPIVFELT
ncbi:MAG TPA: energy transducer TonB [Thermodesulfobacteriota bacterium]|nr:energy transducer TonB [Thermodesulfobacteriota bacterium]